MRQTGTSFVTPGILTLVLETILCLVIGGVIGAVTLVYKEVTIRHVDIDEGTPETGIVYYRVPQRVRATPELQQRIAAAEHAALDQLNLTEGEANTWLYYQYTRMVPLNSEEYEPEKHMAKLDVGNPQVRIDGDKLAMVGIMRTHWFNQPAKDIPLQISGHFEVKEHRATYDVEQVYIGSLPLHKLPMGMLVARRLLQREEVVALAEKPRQFVEKAYQVVLQPESKRLHFIYQ